MHSQLDDTVAHLLGQPLDSLDEGGSKVARHVAERKPIARNVAADFEASADLGQRAADRVAAFGGSWTFVGLFAGAVLLWVAVNGLLMFRQGHAFDPYPYILLNLVLSMLAAIQAPVILMAQNRQSDKDRDHAEHDYEVNLKAELEIMLLHQKLDELRQTQWGELLQMQREQLALLGNLIEQARMAPKASPASLAMPAPPPPGP